MISSAMDCALASDSRTVRSAPFNRNPRISFSISNLASPFSSFLVNIGSLPPMCPDTSGGGNIEWIACRHPQRRPRRNRLRRRRLMSALVHLEVRSVGCINFSISPLSRRSMMSHPVSVAVQKYAGLSAQPICKADGTTIRTRAPGGSGITYSRSSIFASDPRAAAKSHRINPPWLIGSLGQLVSTPGNGRGAEAPFQSRVLARWVLACLSCR
jgi:hypothetical protein